MLLQQNIYEQMENARAMKAKVYAIREELESFQRMLGDMKEQEQKKHAYAESLEKVKERIKTIDAEWATAKASTEALFFANYRKKINIVL
jgi:ATP-dependent Lon protease